MENEKLFNLLTRKNTLKHELPNETWEIYVASAIRIVLECDVSKVKKLVRVQKLFRYIYEHEIPIGRLQGAGWMHAECCTLLDRDIDPRKQDLAEMISRLRSDLASLPKENIDLQKECQ